MAVPLASGGRGLGRIHGLPKLIAGHLVPSEKSSQRFQSCRARRRPGRHIHAVQLRPYRWTVRFAIAHKQGPGARECQGRTVLHQWPRSARAGWRAAASTVDVTSGASAWRVDRAVNWKWSSAGGAATRALFSGPPDTFQLRTRRGGSRRGRGARGNLVWGVLSCRSRRPLAGGVRADLARVVVPPRAGALAPWRGASRNPWISKPCLFFLPPTRWVAYTWLARPRRRERAVPPVAGNLDLLISQVFRLHCA